MLKNLLIVDDNPAMRRLIKSVVEDLVVSIHECKDGSEALAAYERHLPEWVLMDVEIKEMDGITATREITVSAPRGKDTDTHKIRLRPYSQTSGTGRSVKIRFKRKPTLYPRD